MSPCFLFPPPGFEIIVRNDPLNLLEKEKIKEKKHRKKRSKDKKEGEGRKDRDRTKDKHREKKDRKEKQKHKKKNKGRNKDENTIFGSKRIGLQAEGQNAEKLGDSRTHVNQDKKTSNVDELHKWIRDEGASHKMAENIFGSLQKREEGGFYTAFAVDKQGRNGNELFEVIGRERSRNNGLDESAEKDADKIIGWKKKVKDEGKDVKNADRRSEGDNQEKRNKENDDGKHKYKETNTAKAKHVNKHKEDDIFEENVCSLNFQALAPDKDSEQCADVDGIMNKKRKNSEMNGFLHDVLPNRVLKEASSHLHAGKGRTSEASDVTTHSSIGRIGKYTEANIKHNESGFIGIQPSSVDSRHSLAADTGQNGGASGKHPHPDTEYLCQIYTSPKLQLEEEAEFDHQDWLFSSDDNVHSKPVAMFEDSDIPHVWNEVLQIEAADIFALPFVIPY